MPPPNAQILAPGPDSLTSAVAPARAPQARVAYAPTTALLRADYELALQGVQRREDGRTAALVAEETARRALAHAIETRVSADSYLRKAWTHEAKLRHELDERLAADHAREDERRAKMFPPADASSRPVG